MKKKIMAIGAHADDIELRVGGTLLKYLDCGYEIAYVMSTNNFAGKELSDKEGVKTLNLLPPGKQMELRQNEARIGASFFNTTPIHWNYPQRCYNRLDRSLEELNYGSPPLPEEVATNKPTILAANEHEAEVLKVTEFILDFNPEIILTHGMAQKDLEHVATCLLVTKGFWRAVDRGFKGGLLHWRDVFLGLGRINLEWDTYVDIKGFEEGKLKSIGVHRSQACSRNLDSSKEQLKKWGQVCGCELAEIYTTVKLPEESQTGAFSKEIEKNMGSYVPNELELKTKIK